LKSRMSAIKREESEVAPSTVFAVASILEGCSYINGSPQNTFVPGVIELAEQKKVFIGGDDFKSGQTKIKSVLVDFLVSSGIKPLSIVSYNHLGNNDGKNLSAPNNSVQRRFPRAMLSMTWLPQIQFSTNKENTPTTLSLLSMFQLSTIVREPWMNMSLRFLWVEETQLLFITLVKTHYLLLL